jgi:hypothetical protein
MELTCKGGAGFVGQFAEGDSNPIARRYFLKILAIGLILRVNRLNPYLFNRPTVIVEQDEGLG